MKKSGKLPPLPEMVTTLQAQKQSLDWTKDGGEYIPGPLPYLRQSKFHDESVKSSPVDDMDAYLDRLAERDGVKKCEKT